MAYFPTNFFFFNVIPGGGVLSSSVAIALSTSEVPISLSHKTIIVSQLITLLFLTKLFTIPFHPRFQQISRFVCLLQKETHRNVTSDVLLNKLTYMINLHLL